MSEVEILGIILGVFPITCDATKDLSTVFGRTQAWWQFETSFENLISAVATQEIAYTQMLERLIGPLEITNEEYESLLRDPGSNLWHAAHVREQLQKRLPQHKYKWFMDNLFNLNMAIADLQKLLPNEKSELYHLNTSFSAEKDRLLARITDINDDLHRFFDGDSGECLAHQWKCCYATAHKIGINAHLKAAKSPATSKSEYFDILLDAKDCRTQLRLHFEALSTTGKSDKTMLPLAAPKAKSAIDIKNQMLFKQQIKSGADAASEKSVSALAITSLAISAHAVEAPRRSILRNATNKLRKLQSRTRMKSGGQSPSLGGPSEKSTRLSPVVTGTLSTSSTASEVTNDSSLRTAPSRQGEPNLGDVSRYSSTTSSASKVRFADAAPPTPPPEECEARAEEMKSMCELVTNFDTMAEKANTLSVDGKKRVVLMPEPKDQGSIKTSTMQSIDNFIHSTSMRLIRLYIGLNFARSLLCLATSSWIPPKLAKDNIFLVCCGAGGKTTRQLGPYFSHIPYDEALTKTRSQSTWNAKSSLLLLGVVLLELFHGQTLEQQNSWAESLGEDGQPDENTRFCGSFLWICRTTESLKVHFGEELGRALAEAIRKCICFDFGRDDEYGDRRLAEVVYREVVVPLEKCCPPF
ncbi:hypothetical protein BDP81DRAFT_456670 [Colletotrichum phormii]|uniref:DUF7580 domain-containing protein n=1 Tax=Colletotrichum phormii TaxID=359342 RepID=A0AAJ0A3M1_9PEZI|nr:uncharacterized protein BDP81DRAFT_456670 [Colletotrichum phormii]KAK1655850.1 hypothetical protein BDP81DRAFT_456670 [Colletotrichum phormii]